MQVCVPAFKLMNKSQYKSLSNIDGDLNNVGMLDRLKDSQEN